MIDQASQTFYDILEVQPDATTSEIRAAYLRAKSAYKKDSVALYTLMSPEETDELLRKIEEAYDVLSSQDKRRNYDKNHGLLAVDEFATGPAATAPNVVSIDRVPPMETPSADFDPLIAPSTDFTQTTTNQVASDPPVAPSGPRTSQPQQTGSGAFFSASPSTPSSPFDEPAPTRRESPPLATAAPTPIAPPPASTNNPDFVARRFEASQPPPKPAFDEIALSQEIAEETEWRGPFLRRVREAKHISVEEMCDHIKISRTYLFAIEEENFEKLPAPVYLRGFVSQVARFIKLPYEKVTQAYMARHHQWIDQRDKALPKKR